ncbi:MAG: DUF2892 domain-containing protein [Pseudobdellovibrionaceae bacterium]|nr:DUF2892 domain-containing protein [Bdellovibrionales bacterium]USN46202.1 MAG: DUF2892 domain-containing protein [Pseudobdellovibrionaceae bacterium]
MQKNIALWDRLARLTFGTLLLAYAIAGGPAWAYLGIYFQATAAWGVSPFYWLIRNRRKKAM